MITYAYGSAPTEVGIYNRNQESKKKKKRKHALNKEGEEANDQEKRFSFLFFLGRFLGGDRVFFRMFFFS